MQHFTIIRFSVLLLLAGIVTLLLGTGYMLCVAGVLLIGLGCASINPCLVHELPSLVGENASQAVTALQQTAASVGSMLMPLITGFLFGRIGVSLLPWWMFVFTGGLLALLWLVQTRSYPSMI